MCPRLLQAELKVSHGSTPRLDLSRRPSNRASFSGQSSVSGRRARRDRTSQLCSMSVNISFLQTCRLKLQTPLSSVEQPALTGSVYTSFASATMPVLPGCPSNGTQAFPCSHVALSAGRKSLDPQPVPFKFNPLHAALHMFCHEGGACMLLAMGNSLVRALDGSAAD